MIIWRKDEETGLSCGINDNGDVFLGNDYSGYNLPDTPENREYILNDFDRWYGGVNMSNTELKEILAALRSAQHLIRALNDGRKMPVQLAAVFWDLVGDANIVSDMIEED